MISLILLFNYFVLFYFASLGLFYLILIVLSYIAIENYNRSVKSEPWRRVIQSPVTLPISIIAPAFNEEKTISESVQSLLSLEYPDFEVIVVNDGSEDGTLNVLIEKFNLVRIPAQIDAPLECRQIRGIYRSREYPGLVVLDKINGGKSDALNAGINVSRYPLFCAMDADSILEGGALLRITRPFLEKPRETVAVGGIIRVANGCRIENGIVKEVRLPKKWFLRIQTLEYLRAFLFGRTGWNVLKCLLIISGAFGVFKRSVVIEAGGYSRDTVGEDMELVVKIHKMFRREKKRYEISFLPDPVCWTEAPETVAMWRRQRNRWQRGLTDSLWRHRDMLFNPRYGRIGLIAFPYFTFFECLGPVIELSGYIVVPFSYFFGLLSLQFFILFTALAIVFGLVLSTLAVSLEEISFRRFARMGDILILTLAGLLENFGYRQLHTVVRFSGLIDQIRRRTEWGRMKRTGFR